MSVAFNHSTLATTANLITEVQTNLNRGTIGATSTPTSTQVTNWLVRAKEELMEVFGFTWARVFAYMDTVAGEYQYALPTDFASGGKVVRDITQDVRLFNLAPIAFDTVFPDVAGNANSAPYIYCIKDRELWLSSPASGVYRLELEYKRTGEDATAATWTYLPESMLFKLTDYATYRAFMALMQFESAQVYKAEWEFAVKKATRGDGRKKWAASGYKVHSWL